MQLTSVVLSCLLLVSLSPQGTLSSSLVDVKPTCCYHFLKKGLSHHLIRSYKITSSSCPYEAVMFTLKRGKKYCAHLEDKWVQDYLKAQTTNIRSIKS